MIQEINHESINAKNDTFILSLIKFSSQNSLFIE